MVGPCKQEIPWFVEFQKTNDQHGFAVLGVSMDDGGWHAVKPYMEKAHINYPVVIGDDAVAKLFGGLDSLPLTIIIDRAGRLPPSTRDCAAKMNTRAISGGS